MQASSSDRPAATNFILTSASRMIASAWYQAEQPCVRTLFPEENQWAVPMRRPFLVSFTFKLLQTNPNSLLK